MTNIEILESIAKDTLNWSQEVREACQEGAEAIREKNKLNKVLKAWEQADEKGKKV